MRNKGPNSESKTIWDVVVVGGGPAGMMAAGTAASRGARVLLLEKNNRLGEKLLISGGGRCNVTNAELDTRTLLAKYGVAGKFLFSAFAQWGVADTLEFFHTRGVMTKIENELRVFPVSNKAQSVCDALYTYMREHHVTIMRNATVKEFIPSRDNSKITAVRLTSGDIIDGKAFILATGGKSRPETGSTGDGFTWLEALGHTVIDTAPALVPLKLSDTWIKDLQGVALTGVRFTILQGNRRQSVHKGKMLFTHLGVSGPAILNMSNEVRELLAYDLPRPDGQGSVTIVADILPTLDHQQLDMKIQEIFKNQSNRLFANIQLQLIPAALMQTLGALAGITPQTPCHSISRTSRQALVHLIKALPMHVSGTLGLDKAVIASGGIALEEVDFKTMRSRKIPNLYLTGDILNIVRPTGGYSFQLCWTTGSVAGHHAFTK